MKQRCYDPKNSHYPYYGARGIKVCDKWKSDFSAFISDMGTPPKGDFTIDRIDVDGDYTPENCKWSVAIEQARNVRVQNRNRTGYKGVFYHDTQRVFHVNIGANGKHYHIGSFRTLAEAIQARKDAEKMYWGLNASNA